MNNFVAIDLETATAQRSSICQIGVTEVTDGVVQTPRVWLVRPEGNEYAPINISIHGIHPSDTEKAPSFPEVWNEVLPLLQNKIVVAHNTAFDMYALRDALDHYGLEYPTFDYFCTLRIAKYIVKGCYSYSLDAVLNHLDIDFFNHHDAGSDSEGCARLLLKCMELDGSTLSELEEKYNFRHGCFAQGKFAPQAACRKDTDYNTFIREMEINPSSFNEDNYFYGKRVCFTGTCLYGRRKELLEKVGAVGGIPVDSVSQKTDILVVGQQDYRVVGEDGMSNKQEKAMKMIAEGHPIEVLSEKEFLSRI